MTRMLKAVATETTSCQMPPFGSVLLQAVMPQTAATSQNVPKNSAAARLLIDSIIVHIERRYGLSYFSSLPSQP